MDELLETFEMFTSEEIARMALYAAIRRKGVQDVDAFMKEYDITYRSVFRANMGMSLVITEVKKKPSTNGGDK